MKYYVGIGKKDDTVYYGYKRNTSVAYTDKRYITTFDRIIEVEIDETESECIPIDAKGKDGENA